MPAPIETPATVRPGFTDESHPEIYERLPRSNPRKPGQLTDDQIQQFYENGFLLVENFFTENEIEEFKSDIKSLVDDLANKLFNAGKIKNKHEDADLMKRMNFLEEDFPGANILLVKYQKLTPSFRKLACHPRMLNLMEDFLGPDIDFNVIWNMRPKTPSSGIMTVPWHQDNAYFDNRAYEALVMSAWIPLLSTNVTNGTMQYVRGGHKQAKVARHTLVDAKIRYTTLSEEEITKTLGSNMEEDVVTVNVPLGGFILFDNFIPHRSLMNNSDVTRWSLDFRWQKAGLSDMNWGLKSQECVRRADNPNIDVDWDKFESQDRVKTCLKVSEDPASEDDFNMNLTGPWIKKWEVAA